MKLVLRTAVHVRRMERSPIVRTGKVIGRRAVRNTVTSLAPAFFTTFVIDRDHVTPPEVLHVFQDALVSGLISAMFK
jgi:hypothetical protein